MPRHVAITFLAEFFDRTEESAFRRWAYPDDERLAKTALWLVIIIFGLFSLNDLIRVGWGTTYFILVGIRALIIISAFVALTAIQHFPTPRALDISLGLFEVTALGLHWFLIPYAYTSASHATLLEILILMAFYLFLPNQFKMRLVVAIYATLGYLYIDLFLLEANGFDTVHIIVALVLTNLFGFWYGRRMEILRRLNYRELMRERKLRESLEHEISYRRGLEKVLRRSATTDPLTNIYNRRHFLQLGEKEIARSKRYQRPLSVMLIDLDNFKQVNDTLGHSAGDEVLKHLANVISHNLRRNDIFGRIGGDEFAVITPELDIEEALKLAERLRQSMEGPTADSGLDVTISIGVTAFLPGDTSIDVTMNRADKALYESKHLGRNRVASA